MGFFEGRSGIGVDQRRKLFEMKNEYDLTDEHGAVVGHAVQDVQTALAWLARLVTALDVVLPVGITIDDVAGNKVLNLRKPWFTTRVGVTWGDGSPIGEVRRRFRVGKPTYTISDPAGNEVGLIRGEDWRSRNFALVDGSGQEFARVTKKWRGLLTEGLTDADSYAVTFEPSADPSRRALALAGALAIDLIQKQKDFGGPATDILGL